MNIITPFIFFSHQLFSIIIGLFGIGFIIGFHEFGHFIFCKIFNIKTPSFSIGFGPHLISKKIGETLFSLSAIPLGGYVEIATHQEPGATDDAHRYFSTKPYYQKLTVMSAGIFFNLIFSYLVFSCLFLVGLPKISLFFPFNTKPTIASISESSPSIGKLLPGDHITAINNIPLNNSTKTLITTIKELNTKEPSQDITLAFERSGQQETATIALRPFVAGKEILQEQLGITVEYEENARFSLTTSFYYGYVITKNIATSTVGALKNFFVKQDTSQVGGPISIISETIKGVHKGAKIFLLFLAFISISLAILNLLPLPILDGGQVLFHTIEALLGRELPEKVKEYIHVGSWLLIMALTVYLSAKDLYRLLEPYYISLISYF